MNQAVENVRETLRRQCARVTTPQPVNRSRRSIYMLVSSAFSCGFSTFSMLVFALRGDAGDYVAAGVMCAVALFNGALAMLQAEAIICAD
jgi:hypothetical protein